MMASPASPDRPEALRQPACMASVVSWSAVHLAICPEHLLCAGHSVWPWGYKGKLRSLHINRSFGYSRTPGGKGKGGGGGEREAGDEGKGQQEYLGVKLPGLHGAP